MNHRSSQPRASLRSQASRRPRPRLRPGVEGLEGRQLLSFGGSPDTSFGASGIVGTGYPNAATSTAEQANASAIQADGKVVLAGTFLTASSTANTPGLSEFSVSRDNADGTPDTTFGTNGTFIDPALAGTFDGDLTQRGDNTVQVEGVAVQSDGSIVVAGTIAGVAKVVRLTPSGALDPTFGTGGVVTLATQGATGNTQLDSARSVAILAGGPIAVAGAVDTGAAGVTPGVELLNADGSVASSFGTNGLALVALPSGGASFKYDDSSAGLALANVPAMQMVAVLPDGSIAVQATVDTSTGLSQVDEAVISEFNPADGTPVSTFGTNGEAVIPATAIAPSEGSFSVTSLAAQPDGKLVVGGTIAPPNIAFGSDTVLRLDADGSLDPSFGIGGANIIYDTTGSAGISAIDVMSDGRILMGDGLRGVLYRLAPDGLPDPSFGDGGTAELNYGAAPALNSSILALSAQSDGKILVGLGGEFPGIARLLGQGAEGDYDNDGISDPAVFLTALGDLAVRPSSGGVDTLTAIGDVGAGLSLPAPGAYHGGGVTEAAVYNVGTGAFEIQPAGGSAQVYPLGTAGFGNAYPAPGDYGGGGTTELAVYDPTQGAFLYLPGLNGRVSTFSIGATGAGQSIPAEADYFGTGQDDFAVYETATASFMIQNPVNGQIVTVPFGTPGFGTSIPVPGDYDGSGHAELAVYLPASGQLIYRPADGGPDTAITIGTPGVGMSLPEIGDFDGSGHDEAAVYEPATATFLYQPAAGGSQVSIPFGSPNTTIAFSLGTSAVADAGIGPPSGGPNAAPAALIALTPDVLDTLDGTAAKKKAAGLT